MGKINEFSISFPEFKLNDIIDPDEANANNADIVNKTNEIINESNEQDDRISEAEHTIASNINRIVAVENTLPNKADKVDTYTKTEVDDIANTKSNVGHIHDERYYTKTELESYLTGGDTRVVYEVYTIVNADNGDETFTYTDGIDTFIGELNEEGHQIFDLRKGFYVPDHDRISAYINDTLHRSQASGGLYEISETRVALTMPEGNGAEITFKYFERVGMKPESSVMISTTKPIDYGRNITWFKVIE